MGSTDATPAHELDALPGRQLLLDEAHRLLAISDSYIFEVEHFLSLITARVKNPHATGLPTFLRSSQREREAMHRAVADLADESLALDEASLVLNKRRIETSAATIQHAATLWDVLKRCRDLRAVDQVFQGSSRETRRSQVAQAQGRNSREKQQLHRTLKEQAKVEVHVVDGGAEWIDIRWLHPERLLRQMADSGWGWGEHALGEDVDPAEWLDTPLARQVLRVVAAARMNRHEYRIPRVRVVLPNLSRGASVDVDVLLDQLTRSHPSVNVVIDDATSAFLTAPCPDLSAALERLLPDEMAGLTETINLDHTILVDLVSDLTHMKLRPEVWQDRTTRAQIEEENAHEPGGLMARTLYPILQGRRLVCTSEAAEHFHAVLDAVGTPSEKQRGRLLVPHPCVSSSSSSSSPPASASGDMDIRRRFQELSIHALPAHVQVPVQVLSSPWTMATVEACVESGELPPVALKVARCAGFKSSKLSIYMYGWAGGVTTVTSNKEVGGQMRTWVEAHRGDDGDVGPAIWRVDVTRNLLAKNAGWKPESG